MSFLIKIALSCLISFCISVLLGYILIPILKKYKVNQVLNTYLERNHASKKDTPTMGGIIFIISSILTIIILYILGKITLSYNLISLLITFILFGIIGFIDDYLIIKRSTNKGLTSSQKFFMQLIVSVIYFYFFLKGGNEPLLWIHILNYRVNIGVFYGFLILFILTASSNAVNLTDGLDGLAAGLSVMSFITIGIVTISSGWLTGYEEIALFCFILASSLIGFLVFNVSPAKVFMGDTGSLSLGAALGSTSILTRHELLLIIIGLVFVLETLSVILQVSYFKLTKGKRIFKMTPLHHSLEKEGISERNIVKYLWIIGFLASMFTIAFGIWI